MVCISWLGATAFCQWLSSREPGFTYRLPTEAEFEYATRAGTSTARYWGDDWSADLANSGRGGATRMVGSYKANPWGLYDILGNCWEWCNDWCDVDYYSSSPVKDPQGPSSGTYRMIRGGGWLSSEPARVTVRSAYRNAEAPDRSGNFLGFRIARNSNE